MIAERFVVANGLTHHALEHPGGDRAPVLLLHGYLDLAQSFAEVIARLGAAGHRVIAPDFRGHGDSARAPAGSYYHFPDYVADVAALLDALALDRAHVVAHSMGGSVATMLAAVLPERVRSLALLEGIGPPAMPADVAPDRTRLWLEGSAKVRARGARRVASLDEAVTRMRVSNPDVPVEVLRVMAPRALRATDDGGWVFRFDPMHQTTAPGRFDAEAFEAYIARVACPVLQVWGRDPDGYAYFSERAEKFRDTRRVVLPEAGHMMHWTQPDALCDAVLAFLDGVEQGTSARATP